MKYDLVSANLEQYIADNWALTQVQYPNVEFHSDPLTEFVRCTVQFGEAMSRTVTSGCYRQPGILFLTVFVRPGSGTHRLLSLASSLSELVRSVIIPAGSGAPAVQLKVPSLESDLRERDGWIQSQLACPFYYDL